MSTSNETIAPITLVIEWENAIDVDDRWTRRAMAALQEEMARCQPRFAEPPRILYLYDERAVDASSINDTIDDVAPRLREMAEVELVPTPGLTYYKLKNHGVSRSKTDITVMVDSDAGPQPGWLDGLLAPFADPEVMAVGGFTVLGYDDLLSRAMALSWIFDLKGDGSRTVKRSKIHVNNCAVRTEFFRRNPFPDLPGAFKKQCGFWLRDLDRRGIKWVRTADAMTIHAPHPGGSFIVWRAWTMGMDRDLQMFHTVTSSRLGRLGLAFSVPFKKAVRSCRRILRKGDQVDLPRWQRPLAMLIAVGFYSTMFAGQLFSASVRRFVPLPVAAATAGTGDEPRSVSVAA